MRSTGSEGNITVVVVLFVHIRTISYGTVQCEVQAVSLSQFTQRLLTSHDCQCAIA